MSRNSTSETDCMVRNFYLDSGLDAAVTICSDQESLSDLLDFSTLTSCYKRACSRIDVFLEKTASVTADPLSTTFFFFEGGNTWIRHDALVGPVLWLYLIEVLKELNARHQTIRLKILIDVPQEFIKACCDEIGIQITLRDRQRSKLVSLKRIARSRYASPIRSVHLFITFVTNLAWCHPLRSSLQKSGPRGMKRVLFFLRDSKQHRLGLALDQVQKDHAVILKKPKELFRTRSQLMDKHSIYHHLSFSSVCWAYLKSLRLSFVWIRLRPELRRLDAALTDLLQPTAHSLYLICLHFAALKETFHSTGIDTIVESGSYNSPWVRRTCYAASAVGVKSISVVQKAFHEGSLACRFTLKSGDWQKLTLPSFYIVSLPACAELLYRWGVASERVCVGYRGSALNAEVYSWSEEAEVSAKSRENMRVLVVLLTISAKANVRLIAQFKHAYTAVLLTHNIQVRVRAHPNTPLVEQPAVLDLLSDFEWIDCSKADWNDLIIPGSSLVVTPYSTASIEAVYFGAQLVWIPYCSDFAVVNHGLFKEFGILCKSAQEFSDVISQFAAGQLRTAIDTDNPFLPRGDLLSCLGQAVKH